MLVRGADPPAEPARCPHPEEAPVLTFDIDRSSPMPLYFQLAQAIEGAIAGGALPAGSRLENEVLLAQRYGLSRPTVRRAVQELVAKGLLLVIAVGIGQWRMAMSERSQARATAGGA